MALHDHTPEQAAKIRGAGNTHNSDNPGPSNPGPANPGPPIASPGPQLPGAPLGGGGMSEEQVVAGYMSLNVMEKKVLITALDGILGEVLKKVLPGLEPLIQEAMDTRPEQIVNGTTPPRSMRSGVPGQAIPPAAPAGSLSSAAIPQSVNPLSAIR